MIELVGVAVVYEQPMHVRSIGPYRCDLFRRGSIRPLTEPVPLLADHDWSRQLGVVTGMSENGNDVMVTARAWDPQLRRALEAGYTADLSVCTYQHDFQRRPDTVSASGVITTDEFNAGEATWHITDALVREVSVVGRGACPGAGLIGWRPLMAA